MTEEKERFEILLEDIRGKFDLLVDGQKDLRRAIDENSRKLDFFIKFFTSRADYRDVTRRVDGWMGR